MNKVAECSFQNTGHGVFVENGITGIVVEKCNFYNCVSGVYFEGGENNKSVKKQPLKRNKFRKAATYLKDVSIGTISSVLANTIS